MQLGSTAALGLGLLGCGGGATPSAPSAPSAPPAAATPTTSLPAGTVFELVSGDTTQPVAGAAVTIGARSYTSDASGRVVLAESATSGAALAVVAAGFLDRETLVRSNAGQRIVLWPQTTWGRRGLTPEYTQTLVYTDTADGSTPGASPLRRLSRSATQVTIVLSQELRLDDMAQQSHHLAVAATNDALGGRATYVLADSRPPSGLVIEARLDPSESLCTSKTALAFTRLSLQGGEITSAQIVYCGLQWASTAIALHEIGHSAGFRHSFDRLDVMYPYNRTQEAFGLNERLLLWMLFERPGGNRFPDNDREVAPAVRETVTIVCR